jgi:hypothetical protein
MPTVVTARTGFGGSRAMTATGSSENTTNSARPGDDVEMAGNRLLQLNGILIPFPVR